MNELIRLLPVVWRFRFRLAALLAATLSLTAILMVTPTIIRLVIDVGLARGDPVFIAWMAFAALMIGIMRAGLLYSQRYLSEWIANHIGFELRNRLYDHIQHLPFAFHDRARTGQLISRCIEDVRAIERFTGYGLNELIRLGLLMVGIIGLLMVESSKLAAIALLPLLPLLLITIRFGRKVGGLFYKVDVALGDLSSQVQENVSGVEVVRAFAREDFEIAQFANKNKALFQARLNVVSQFALVMPTTHFLVALGTILILWFGGKMVLKGELTVGEVIAFNAYLLLLSQPAQQLAWLVNTAGEAVAGAKRAFEILDLKPEITSPIGSVVLPMLAGRVEFQSVGLHYQDQKISALDDIDLVVEPNQVVALIGPTGSGKTSLVSLIPRFYDPSGGAVLIDGVDLRKVDLESLRRQIGIVLQTSLLFSTTVSENIAYGCPDASQTDIESAAQAAQAHDFILQLPDGYQTVLGERGVTLSGGQRQRVAIARALLMDPRILILDDSTSSVDTQTEKQIQLALQHIMQGRTTFVIAHRISTVHRADLILVMENGKIVARGKHDQLISSNPLYKEIYSLQLSSVQVSEQA